MRIKFVMLAMVMCTTAMTFSACSDDDNDNKGINVPEAVAQSLKQKYPSATGVEWEQKGAYYVADCRMDGKDLDVWFDANAHWQMTETDINWDNLPAAVQTAFTGGNYASWEREDYDMLEYPSDPVQFVIEVEQGNQEYQLFYSEDGGLINTVDITNKDDTIYPPKA